MKKKNSGIIVFSDLPLSYASAANWWMFLLTVICGICSIVQVYAVSGFVDVALQMAQHTHLSGHLLTNLFILMSTVAVDWLTPRIQGILRQKSELELLRKYRPILLEKCARLEYTHIECAESHDLINRILDGTERKWMNIYQAMLDLLKLLISIVGILLVIACYVWWAAILILIFCIPLFLYSIKSGKKNYQAQRDTSYYVRKYQYLEQVLNERESLNERKLFGFSDEINKKYADTYKEAFLIETGTQIHWALKTKISGGVSSVAALLIVITLIQPTLAGNISIGLFISLVNAVFLLTSQMSWGLSRNIDALVNGNEFCKDMRTFWHLSEDEGVLELPLYVENIEKIEFRNVSFRYQGADFDVLKNVSFIMRKGKNYALVGANGAGKTTVIKLLTGLYTDYKGEILINGKELRKYTSAEQKGMFSVVYQDFVQHSLTFRENCEIGDLCHAISESQIGELFEQFKLMEVVENSPNRYDTLLGKTREGGIDLSGGQWQKLAMVRALLRPAPIRILDEPTASLDPKMESEIYQLFQQLTNEKMTILISHRLGFARLADEIIVFDQGEICERGSYDELMKINGLFCKMYEEQRSWYE